MNQNTIKIYLFAALMAATYSLTAQNILVGLGSGGGTFEMSHEKAFNQSTVNLLPFKPVLMDNFPPYFFYKAEVLYSFPHTFAVGVNVSTTSTGSRLSLADYSGKYTMDQQHSGIFPGIKILLGEAPGKSNGLNLSLEGGFAFSTMKVDEKATVLEETVTNNDKFKATGFYAQPGLCYFINISSKVKICANVSYYKGFEKGYHVPGERDQKIVNSETFVPIRAQWDGIRCGITAYWNFPGISKPTE